MVLELPLVMARLVMAAPVTLEPTINIGKSLEGPPPATVTRFLSVAPLPEAGPVMVVFDGMFSVPLVSVMVCAVAKTGESKLMLAPPAAVAAARASRRLQ